MRILRQVIYGLFAAAMVAGCTSDLPGDDPNKLPEDDGSGFFMALDIQMPSGATGSRSETIDPDDDGTNSSGGIEIGSDAENTVTTALIVLAAKEAKGEFQEFGLIATGMVQNNRINTTGDKEYRAIARLQKDNLNAFYETYGVSETGHEVYVFVFCNPTNDLITKLQNNKLFGTAAWLDFECPVVQGNPNKPNENIGIWGTNSFLMNNLSLAVRALPGKSLDWEKYNSVEKPFHLSEANLEGVNNSSSVTNADNTTRGPVKVQRSVARFDFKDGSDDPVNRPNTYDVLNFGPENDPTPIVEVQLQKMCLVNMSNSFYYLLRVSDNGTPTGTNFAYCAPELPWTRNNNGLYINGNYVVGPYWNNFSNEGITSGFYDCFNFPFFADTDDELTSFDNGNWDVVKITDVLKGQPDNYKGQDNPKPDQTASGHKPGDYKIWRYVTENVIPAPEKNQVNSVSTGVVFKAQIKGTKAAADVDSEEAWNKGYVSNMASCLNGGEFTYEGKTVAGITGNSATDPILYYFDGHLYMGWRHIRQAAIQASVTINTAGVIEINRSTSLYKAVFGDGPIPPSYNVPNSAEPKKTVFMDADNKAVTLVDPQWPADNVSDKYKQSADYAWQTWFDNTKPEEGELLNNMRAAITGKNITIYQSSEDDFYGAGYYCYYYYWNRHNDNGIPGTMAPMEFSVVRNNVYKLSVDKVSRLGHPRIPQNDPDNPEPDTPDESDRIYLDVQVQIVPWVVRLNSIVF